LDTFGPELDLADALLQQGRAETVVAYLNGIQRFWEMDDGRVAQWIQSIKNGEQPTITRFAPPTVWQWILYVLSMLWPLIVTVALLAWRWKKISRKVAFFLIALIVGYIAFFGMDALSNYLLVNVIPSISDNVEVLITVYYGIVALVFAFPLVLIVGLLRKYSN
jgi:hypothetical protein